MAGDTPLLEPSQAFLDARKKIEEHAGENKVVIHDVIKAWSPHDQASFLKWFVNQGTQTLDQRMESESKSQPMSSKLYEEALAAVDFSSVVSISGFMSKTFGTGFQHPPSPMFLGFDNSFQYCLKPEQSSLPVSGDLAPGTPSHPYIVELRSSTNPPKASPLKYGFCLGTLVYYYDRNGRFTGNPEFLKTPFRVYLDVISQLVYIIFDGLQWDDNGDEVTLDLKDTWEHLPSPQNNRKAFDTLCVGRATGGRGDLGSVSNTNSFFDAKAMDAATFYNLRAWAVSKDVVEKAIQRSNVERGIQGGNNRSGG